MVKIPSKMIPTILRRYDIRPTGSREAVLKILSNARRTLSHANIEEAMQDQSDRVTIFRTLNLFKEKHLVHKVVDGEGIARYALCDTDKCDINGHHDNHIHFICECCQEVFCIHNQPEINISLPDNYSLHDIQIIGRGLCPACTKRVGYEEN